MLIDTTIYSVLTIFMAGCYDSGMANAILDRADQIISAYNAGAGYKAVLIANLVNTLCVSCRHRFGHERQYFKTGVCGLLPIETSGARCSYYDPV